MYQLYLSLGSNIEKERNLPLAVKLLAASGRLQGVSQVFETTPVGGQDRPLFWNAAVLLETGREPSAFKRSVIDAIETELGRVRDPRDKNAPRTIDIDLALWRLAAPGGGAWAAWQVSDPDILRFVHVAAPLADLAPDLVHPVSGERLATIAARLASDGQDVVALPDVNLTQSEGGR